MTPAEVRRAIAAHELDANALNFLARVSRFARADMRAHAVLLAPQVIATFHPCGHTSWVDYDLPGHRGGMCEAACAMLARRWTAAQGGVYAPCPECLPQRNRARSGRPKARKGPAWRKDAGGP